MSSYIRNGPRQSYALRGDERPSVLLFAEGSTEASFLDRWLKIKVVDPKNVGVICVEGRNKLEITLRNIAEDENFNLVNSFGFLFDAELNPATSTFDAIRQVLQKVKLIQAGETIAGGVQTFLRIKVAVYVAPDNLQSGKIENIVLNEIQSTHLSGCINGFGGLVQDALGHPADSKTLVQAYLGIKKPGLCGTGHGFNQGKLDVMHPAYQGIRDTIEPILPPAH